MNDTKSPAKPEAIVKDGPTKAFGVGCFHFGLKNTDGYNVQTYVTSLTNYLKRVPNIEELKVSDLRYTSGREVYSWLDTEGEITSGHGIYPWPTNWSIDFKLNLSALTQKSVVPFMEPLKATKFSVKVVYDGAFPVAFVETNDIQLRKPSDAVVIVRKYMEQHGPG